VSGLDAGIRDHASHLPQPIRSRLAAAIDPAATDRWLRDILMAYLRMFERIFERQVPRDDAERTLADDLLSIAGGASSDASEIDVLASEEVLAHGFADRDLVFLGGRTPPYLGPYIWARTEDRQFEVALPRGAPQPVTVHFMHAFLLRGWLHWRSRGEQGAGGWYQQDNPPWPDGLYCVADRYPEPLETNRTFQVSLLGHEAQHVADHHAHPGLESRDLEYRAKLVELIGYDSASERLEFFLDDAADDPDQPHPWAAHRIARDLEAQLGLEAPDRAALLAVPYDEVKGVALRLLDEDTARRAGASA